MDLILDLVWMKCVSDAALVNVELDRQIACCIHFKVSFSHYMQRTLWHHTKMAKSVLRILSAEPSTSICRLDQTQHTR